MKMGTELWLLLVLVCTASSTTVLDTKSQECENITLDIGETLIITSPNYPANYPNDVHYTWYVTAVSGYNIFIHFLRFDTETCCDFLKIGTGYSPTSPESVEVASLSGNSTPQDIRMFMIYEPKSWIQFTSNSDTAGHGFEIQLKITVSTTDEIIRMDLGDSLKTSSPNYPLNYDDNTEYTWYISAPPGKDILVRFSDFNLGPYYDFLRIGNGDSPESPDSLELYKLSGYSPPLGFGRRIYGPTGWMRFTSDSRGTYKGFDLELSLYTDSHGGHCLETCCACGHVGGCNCYATCQSRGDCCYDYTPHCSQVRLAVSTRSGYSYMSGTVELFANGVWGTVCDHDWDMADAHVVCRSMGYHRASHVYNGAYFGQGTGEIHLDHVNCSGRESSIWNCFHNGVGVHNCTHANDAGVTCSISNGGYCQGRCDLGFLESGSCFCDVYCQEFDDCCDDYEYHCTQVRLRDGSSYIEGRVEVLHGGIWGTVCDNSWDIDDARVICKSIGYPGVEGAFSNAAFGEGTGDIILDNVECTGEEWNIFRCPHNGLGVHNCSHADDAGVRCSLSNEENVTIIPGEKQKLESPNYLGNYYDNTVYIWLITAPPGYHVLITFLSMSLPPCGDHMTIGTGYSPTSPDSVQLAFISGHGEPDDIRLYTPTGWIQFSSDDSGISDGFVLELNSINSTAAPVRLANGSYPNEGRVEVYSNSLGTWGTICDSGWDHQDASVICRSMGYPDAVASYGGALFGMGSGPVLMGNVSCNGTENSVFYCPYGSGDTIDECEHSEDAGVVCYPNVRLVNGDSPSEGRVEVYHDGQWGTVCESYWGINETRVLCRSLGFPGTLVYFPDAYFGEGTGDILLMVRSCDGDEDSIFDCCHFGLGYHDRDRCGHYADVGVRCQSNVRLANGNSSNEGRVEVYHGDKWGTVCDNGWGLEEAGVICKSLGYPGALQAFGNGSFGQGSGDILLDEVDCIGDESSIFYCSHDGVGVSSCSHGEDAGVRCALETSTPHYSTSLGISTSAQTSSEIIETTRSYSTESDTAATVVTSDSETTRYVEEITTTWTTTEMNLMTTTDSPADSPVSWFVIAGSIMIAVLCTMVIIIFVYIIFIYRRKKEWDIGTPHPAEYDHSVSTGGIHDVRLIDSRKRDFGSLPDVIELSQANPNRL